MSVRSAAFVVVSSSDAGELEEAQDVDGEEEEERAGGEGFGCAASLSADGDEGEGEEERDAQELQGEGAGGVAVVPVCAGEGVKLDEPGVEGSEEGQGPVGEVEDEEGEHEAPEAVQGGVSWVSLGPRGDAASRGAVATRRGAGRTSQR